MTAMSNENSENFCLKFPHKNNYDLMFCRSYSHADFENFVCHVFIQNRIEMLLVFTSFSNVMVCSVHVSLRHTTSRCSG